MRPVVLASPQSGPRWSGSWSADVDCSVWAEFDAGLLDLGRRKERNGRRKRWNQVSVRSFHYAIGWEGILDAPSRNGEKSHHSYPGATVHALRHVSLLAIRVPVQMMIRVPAKMLLPTFPKSVKKWKTSSRVVGHRESLMLAKMRLWTLLPAVRLSYFAIVMIALLLPMAGAGSTIPGCLGG